MRNFSFMPSAIGGTMGHSSWMLRAHFMLLRVRPILVELCRARAICDTCCLARMFPASHRQLESVWGIA